MDSTKQGKPEVSIIIPTYNESENIIRVLDSIGEYLQNGLQVEAIVVDDNSPDGTGKVVEDYISKTQTKDDYSNDQMGVISSFGAGYSVGSVIIQKI